LFKKRAPKRLPGYLEFILKVKSMGLGHLIESSHHDGKGKSQNHDQKIEKNEDYSDTVQWWYIGQ